MFMGWSLFDFNYTVFRLSTSSTLVLTLLRFILGPSLPGDSEELLVIVCGISLLLMLIFMLCIFRGIEGYPADLKKRIYMWMGMAVPLMVLWSGLIEMEG